MSAATPTSEAQPGGRLPIVGVMGSGGDAHDELARPLGRWLAYQEVHLLTGGGRGAMEAVSRAFHGVSPRRGLVIGILPGSDVEGAPPLGYPNPWIEVSIRTHLPARGQRGSDPDSRNHVNVLSSDVVIALPGGPGTASETALALDYGRPVVAWRPAGTDPTLPADTRQVPTFVEVQAFVRSHLNRLAAQTRGLA
ncbi:MAG: LOG family protein [Gemmatimonadetes bacterium]|nr:LOG family protein [Gemmatimonadota bacterium]